MTDALKKLLCFFGYHNHFGVQWEHYDDGTLYRCKGCKKRWWEQMRGGMS